MSANTVWNVTVRKLCTEVVQVLAATPDEAFEEARRLDGVVLVEGVEWDDPDQRAREAGL